MPGPIGKRNGERMSPDTTRNSEEVAIDVVVEPLAYDESWGWGDIARDLFQAAHDSGQSMFYEPTDWQTLRLVCEQVDRELKDKFQGFTPTGEVIMRSAPIPGASLTAITKLMSVLMLTEGDRRRLKLEIQRKQALEGALPDDVADMDAYRERMLGG